MVPVADKNLIVKSSTQPVSVEEPPALCTAALIAVFLMENIEGYMHCRL